MKKGGTLGVLMMRGSDDWKKMSVEKGFSLEKEWVVIQGGEKVNGMVFVKE